MYIRKCHFPKRNIKISMKIFRIVSGNNCDNKEICDISDHRF